MIFFRKPLTLLTAAGVVTSSSQFANGFSPTLKHGSSRSSVGDRDVLKLVANAMASVTEDCGCQETVFSGKPSEIARTSNPREAIRKKTFFSVNGDEVTMDDLIGKPSEEQISVVVFLRSLG
jgi:hypothetical protein